MPVLDDRIFSIRDIIDSQLETSDDIEISRVADIEAEQHVDGKLVLTYLVVGPQALAGRVAAPLRSFFKFLLRDRFEHRIAISDVEHFGPTLRLKGKARDYKVGQSERWIANHILRWIPLQHPETLQYPGTDRRNNKNAMQPPTPPGPCNSNRATPTVSSSFAIGELLGGKIKSAEGQMIGHVADLQLSEGPEYVVTALFFGRSGWLHRWHVLYPFVQMFGVSIRAKTVPWDAVESIESGIVRLKPG